MATQVDQTVLDLIRRARANTQADLCRATGLRSSTMSYILRRLTDRGLVRPLGLKLGRRGKAATLLCVDPGGLLLGLDVSPNQAHLGLLDFAGQLRAQITIANNRQTSPGMLMSVCRQRLPALLKAGGAARETLQAVGVGVCGRVSALGMLEFSAVLPWRRVPLREMAAVAFGLRAFVCDGWQHALVESRYGAARGRQRVLYLSVADSIISALVLGGEISRGRSGVSPEIAHLIFESDGPRCGCGSHGCLEAMISGPAVCRRIVSDGADARLHGEEAPPQHLLATAQLGQPAQVAAELVALAERGEGRYAQQVLSEVVDLTGKALAMLCACHGPDLVVLDGYFFRQSPALQRQLAATARAYLGLDGQAVPEVASAALGPEYRLASLVPPVLDALAAEGQLRR